LLSPTFLVPLRYWLLLICSCAGGLAAAAQPATGRADSPQAARLRLGVLIDRDYSWERIRADSTLAFAPADSLHPARARRYWLRLRLHNPNHYPQALQLRVLPDLDNTLYYFDEEAQAWRTRRAGKAVVTDSQRTKGRLPLYLPGRATTTCYVRVVLGEEARLPPAVHLHVSLEAAAVAARTEQFYRTAWLVSLAVLALLLLSNLLAFLRRPDPLTRWYVCTQVGALLYVTAFRGYFRALLPGPVWSAAVPPDGRSYVYEPNNLAIHLAVVLLLLGLGQVTRAYLDTRRHLPRLDTALRVALLGYGVFSAGVLAVNLGGFYLEAYSLGLDNLLVLGVVGLLLALAVGAYRRRLPLAGTYLVANLLPVLGMGVVALQHLLVSVNNDGNLLLPDVVILAHALGFAAALHLRLHHAQQHVLTTEREAAALALDIERQQLRHREIVLKNGHIQAALLAMQQRQQAHAQQAQQLSTDMQAQQQANHALQQQLATHHDLQAQLEANQRELASTSLYVQQKNALLAELQAQLRELHRQRPGAEQPPALAGVRSLLQAGQYLDEDWSRFKRHFEQVHPRFFEELQAKYPALTSHEQRLYCYFHINLSTKEIAALLNIDPASVRRAKTRLYKKIGAADQDAGRPAPAEGPAEE
jgi:DNA-binding CsgD family transcriptional regulator